jgi:methylaspartate mutase sigma subunit
MEFKFVGSAMPDGPTVILGVAASDAHAVANHLLAMRLRLQGFRVINLGVCTPLEEFADALDANPEAVAVAIGSLNGHAYEDLRDLPALRRLGRLRCPVILGGNLSVGSHKNGEAIRRLYDLGIEHILVDAEGLAGVLERLAPASSLDALEVSGA